MFETIAKTNTRQQLARTFASLLATQTSERKRERNVLACSHCRNEVEVLKDHADGETPVTRHLFLRKRPEGSRRKKHFTVRRVI